MNTVKKNNRFVFPSLINDLFMDERLDVFNNLRTNVPQVNIKESNKDFTVQLAAPGLKKEDFSINLEDSVLTIASQQTEHKETTNESEKFTRREFAFNSFTRSFTLPEEVKYDEIAATYTDGILEVKVPKDVNAKLEQKRTIAIS